MILSKGNVINKEDIIFTEQKEINKFHEAIEAIVQTAFLYGEAKPYEKNYFRSRKSNDPESS